MIDLRRQEGNSAIARRTIPRISSVDKSKVVVDGIRSLDEVVEFKRHFQKFSLIAIHASPETRFKRLYARRRSDDAGRWQLFQERDTRELSVGLGNTLAMAQHIIMNEESADVARVKIKQILLKVEKEWMK
jgi:dephospho-CoA kinase